MDIDLSLSSSKATPFVEHARIEVPRKIFRSEGLYGWVVSSYDDVKQVLLDPINFANEKTPMSVAFGADAMLVIDSPLHHKIRGVWAKPASVGGVATMGEDIERIADKILVPFAKRLHAGEAIDIFGTFEEFTSEVTTKLMDIPRERKQDLLRWNRIISDAPIIAVDESDPRFAARRDAKKGVFDFLRPQVEDRREKFARGEQPNDLISLMVAAEGRDGITPSIALDNLLNLVLGALDTTVRWMGSILVVLHRYPEMLAEVRANRSLLPQAMEEVMRLESVVQMTMRIARNDNTELSGQPLKAGDFVYMLSGAANRDPAAFERPADFDIRRKPKVHLGFGFGMHQCLGMNIARKEVAIFMNRLFDLVPALEIAECDYGTSWSLWGPQMLKVRAAKTDASA